jgi:hypothetical protein
MRSILGLSSVAIVTALLATAAGSRIAAAGPDDCSISGMQGSFACPLSTWDSQPAPQPAAPQAAAPAPQQQVVRTCTPRYELYSSHVKWVNDCTSISQLPETAPAPAH